MRDENIATARAIALLVPLALMLGALGSQFIGHLVPCEMCVWQRYPHVAAIAAALLAFVAPGRPLKAMFVALAALGIATSGVIGVLHAGVEYGWWPGFTPCTAHLNPGDDILATIQSMPLVRCDTPQWTLLGISLAGFNALISIAGALAVFATLLWMPRR